MHVCLDLPAGEGTTSTTYTATTLQPADIPSTGTYPEVCESIKAAPVDPADWPALSDMVMMELVSRGHIR